MLIHIIILAMGYELVDYSSSGKRRDSRAEE